MRHTIMKWTLMILLAGRLFAQAEGEQGKNYPDGHGGQVYFPLGDLSFVDEVVSFEKGTPSAAEKDSQPVQALGIPDYDEAADSGYVTLGCGGTLTLRFADNALVDVSGPDLYVFEIGPAVEPTDLSISKDGQQWIHVGKISGGRAEVDIKDFVKPGDIFHFVRLTDLKSDCSGSWPGADIDAVGAIGSGLQFSLSSAVLFDFNRSVLKAAAQQRLHAVASKIKLYPRARIIVEGHTDSRGSESYNQKLSERRARAVRDYLTSQEDLRGYTIEVHGYGESRPIASNDSEEGRSRNRRVEIIVVPED